MTAETRKKILIVDDEVGFTTLLKLSLERTGEYEVRVENDGAEGLAAAREFEPDLILLDFVMPHMDGHEVASRFRLDEAVRDVPIVFMTALAPGQTDHGQPFLTKPATLEEIVGCIEKNLPSS